MCGIAGVRRFGDNPINAEEVKTLLCSLEYRGNHATGIALMTSEGIQIHKEAVPASSFIATKETKEFLDTWLPEASIALLHTRFATLGDPGNNDNNHPFYAGGVAVVHNGSISNHDYLFNSMKLKRNAETDSDVIRAILDEKGITPEGVKALNKMSGSAAVAAISEEEPDKLLLARSGSPLVYGLAKNGDKLWWASDMTSIQRAVRPWVRIHGLWARENRSDIAYFTVPDHTAYILDAVELRFRDEFKVCVSYTPPPYVSNPNYIRTTYAAKQRIFKKEREQKTRSSTTTAIVTTTSVTNGPNHKYTHKVAPCPHCEALCYIPRDRFFTEYTCHKCKKTLSPIAVNKITFAKDPAL